MPKFIPFPSIDQFRNVISNVNSRLDFVGKDANNKPIYKRDVSVPRPKLLFTGTVKLHGTNAAVCMDKDGIWFQSRNNIITEEQDNAGFAKFAASRKQYFGSLLSELRSKYELNTACLFGEWCGENIQSGVALSKLSKRFIFFSLFGLKQNDEAVWLKFNDIPSSPENLVFNIHTFPTWQLEIDFERPKLSQNELSRLTDEVEKECPVGKYFGVSGTGEGIVWIHHQSPDTVHRFKVKGKVHSSSKVKTLAPVDVEKVNSIKEFVEYACTESRLNQGLEQVIRMRNREMSVEYIVEFIKWVIGDIEKEETDTMDSNGLKMKDCKSSINAVARQWFLQKLENNILDGK
jgi:hypothetical protein